MFPDTPLLAQFADPDINQPFVRSAIASVWESGKDSRGVYPPDCEPYDRSWVDKYIPRPETLHLRAWTSIDPYDPAAPVEVVWVNYKGEVEKYELIEQDDSGSVESITKTIEEQEKDYLPVVPEQNEDEDEDEDKGEGEGEDEARSANETSKTPINTVAVANAAVHGAQRPKVSSHSKGATNTPITSSGRLPPSQTEGSSCSRSPLRERRQIPSGTPSGSSRAKPHPKTNTKTARRPTRRPPSSASRRPAKPSTPTTSMRSGSSQARLPLGERSQQPSTPTPASTPVSASGASKNKKQAKTPTYLDAHLLVAPAVSSAKP